MKILIGCECSGVVRDAFRAAGHDAWSCDLLENEGKGSQHILGDVRLHLSQGWDMLICHPPCTYLTNSAAWAFKEPNFDRYPGVGYHQKLKPGTLTGRARREAREDALCLCMDLMDAPIKRIAMENPIGALSTFYRKPDQIIQPYFFGDDASKQTCLWLKNLPPLKFEFSKFFPPRIVNGKERWGNQTDSGQNRLSPSDDRASERSVTYAGIAKAMADQWGKLE